MIGVSRKSARAQGEDRDADLALIEAVIRGDPSAQRRFIEKTDRIIDACFARLRARSPWLCSDEADLKQRFRLMLLEDGHRALKTFQGRSALTTWIHVVAARFFQRQAGAIRARQPAGEPSIDLVDPGESVENSAMRRAAIARVRDVVGALDDRDRLLLRLLYEQELDAPEAGKLLGLSASGVRMRKQRLLARLMEELEGVA